MAARINKTTANSLIDEVVEATPKALNAAVKKLPADFPGALAQSIVHGVKARVAQLERGREQ